ncbi:MAG: UvrD-helicase domain-containing protein [Alphaproteobacteria bacterium]|nr:UvrD-helicase domain-containing protein [Alphaproteobacteria bacterium]
MDSFGAVRALANMKHALMRAKAGGKSSAAALLTAARETEAVTAQSVAPDHPLLAGGDGALHRAGSARSIYISAAIDPELAAYVEAHEFGHLWIETPNDPVIVPRGSDPGTPEEPTPLGLRRVEVYSAQEHRERCANVFAREFLLPRDEARRLFIDGGQSAVSIASSLGLPTGLVHQQLAVALLLPEPASANAKAAPSERPGLDASQKKAAEHEGSPLLVEAGPGTGKTRTLIARVEHLLANHVPTPSILVLTFSNKAAREIRERVAASVPAAATELWAGTFHAFGLELVRKFGHLDGIREPVQLLDQADQLAFLERELPALGLDHYLRLHEPLLELRYILGAISRAKDEVFSPADYAAAAVRMQNAARNDEDRLKADKAGEVARVYNHYERRIRADGIVDFADLINRPIEILRKHPDICDELRTQYRHLLVDEYQDVNRASALLLKELTGDGERLWVVGDARQSIYRFRGAAPINTRDFEKDYPNGKRKPLAVNYRSRKQIVDTFGAYAKGMRVGRGRSCELEAKRGEGVNPVDCHIATDRNAEIAGIAATIAALKADGVAYRDQAVLCRTHGNLEKIALGLEAAGFPVLYLGDLFERPEIRDLLALLSFVSEPHRGGLHRVATLAPYRTPLHDVRVLLDHAAATEKTPLAALADAGALPGLSADGRRALVCLSADVASVGFKTGPGAFLCDMLFNRGALLRAHLEGNTAADQHRRLAVHQFLQFAIENDTPGEGDPKRSLLNWVRRLEVFGDERALRDPPVAVEEIDAVRLMTVHASKGLEFKVVHLPTLGAGIFPLRWQGERCPAPLGMLPTIVADDHKEEEECLFFVALSRARDHLSLSRAQRYSDKQASNPSDALKSIASRLPRACDGPPTWTGRLPDVIDTGERADLKVTVREHDGGDIELYLGCPRRYLYQVVLGLSGSREDNGYVRFHRAVYRVLRWMGGQGDVIETGALMAEFERAWSDIGPFDHPLKDLYRKAARRILDQATGRSRVGISFGDVLHVVIDGHNISIPIDEVERSANGFTIRRLRTGRPPKKPDQRVLHALMAEAGRQAHGGGGRFELQYLTTNEAVGVSLAGVMTDRLEKTREALAGLACGLFAADPDNRENCPRCPHYFICPAVPH